ncbi:MAG: lipid-A-disaccharide synthase, partial [Bacteroidetes bacterium]
YVIAGEDSGDLHASNLIRALKQRVPDLSVRGLGGDRMAAAGAGLVAHVRDINFMGFREGVRNLRTIRRLFRTVKADIAAWKPDAVVLVDYPGFNLRLAPFIKQLGLPVYYYISPQLWAWKQGRVKKIRQYVDRMLVILPFEADFYARHGVDVDFVGHPLLDAIGDQTDSSPPVPTQRPVLALLPGSRRQEIQRMLPVMLSLVSHFPEYECVIAGAPSQPESFYRQLMGDKPVRLVMNQTYALLRQAELAVVTSGTATLETALHGVPQVVAYKGGFISYQIGRRLVKVKFISLVNLILDRPAVTELIQDAYTPARLRAEVTNLTQPAVRQRLADDYADLRHRLGEEGASERAAAVLLSHFSGTTTPNSTH